mmetsp:Transcript_144288/g.462138  ORF Transcript_144288/g.462138 Transcript_144288/m.462138 type:complete len:153 (+) Transcript_144288:448-906(+)
MLPLVLQSSSTCSSSLNLLTSVLPLGLLAQTMSGSSAAGAAPPCSSTSPRPIDEGPPASSATDDDSGMCSESSYLLSSSSTSSLDLPLAPLRLRLHGPTTEHVRQTLVGDEDGRGAHVITADRRLVHHVVLVLGQEGGIQPVILVVDILAGD